MIGKFLEHVCFIVVTGCLGAGFVLSVVDVFTYIRSANWESVSAQIEQMRLIADNGERMENQTFDGDNGRIECRYRYTFNNRQYVGESWDVLVFSHRGGPVAVERYETLQRHLSQSEPIDVLVNPDKPSESAIYRDAPVVAMFWIGLCLFLTPAALVSIIYRHRLRNIEDSEEKPQITQSDTKK